MTWASLSGSSLMAPALAFHVLTGDFPSLLVLRPLAGAASGVLSGAAGAGDLAGHCDA